VLTKLDHTRVVRTYVPHRELYTAGFQQILQRSKINEMHGSIHQYPIHGPQRHPKTRPNITINSTTLRKQGMQCIPVISCRGPLRQRQQSCVYSTNIKTQWRAATNNTEQY